MSQSLKSERSKSDQSLTIGCEFEFLLATYSPRDRPEPRSFIQQARPLHDALKEPMLFHCRECNTLHPVELKLRPLGAFSEAYDMWVVESDWSVELMEKEKQILGENAKDYIFQSVELRSRVLDREHKWVTKAVRGSKEELHDIEISYEEEIQMVLERIQERFCHWALDAGDGTRTKSFVFTNPTCGFHVHVGHGDDGFSIDTAKKVFNTFVGCERQIDGLHGVSRISGSKVASRPFDIFGSSRCFDPLVSTRYRRTIDKRVSNVPLSLAFFRLATEHRRREVAGNTGILSGDYTYPYRSNNDNLANLARNLDIGSWMKITDNASTMADVLSLHRNKAHTLNLWQLDQKLPKYDGSSRNRSNVLNTIEFRQADSVLHVDEALAFIDFAAHVVLYAEQTSREEYAALMYEDEGAFRQPQFNTLDLLRALGCSPTTVRHYENRHYENEHSRDLEVNPALWQLEQASNSAKRIVEDFQDPFTKVILYNLEKKKLNLHPDKVAARIYNKFILSGYGQFKESYLSQILKTDTQDELRKWLTLGSEWPYGSNAWLDSSDDDSEDEAQAANRARMPALAWQSDSELSSD